MYAVLITEGGGVGIEEKSHIAYMTEPYEKAQAYLQWKWKEIRKKDDDAILDVEDDTFILDDYGFITYIDCSWLRFDIIDTWPEEPEFDELDWTEYVPSR